jgi:threonine dehydrogenase-like Zn-dependent dehydrogenase
MKALVKSKPTEGLWLAEVPVPEVGVNDVLVRIRKTSICGTDVHIWNWDVGEQDHPGADGGRPRVRRRRRGGRLERA